MEASILLWIQENIRNDILTPIMVNVTKLGDYGIFWSLLALGFLGIAIYIRRAGGRKDNPFLKPAMVSLFAMLLCFIIGNLLLKNVIARTRPYDRIPELITLTRRPSDYSFPSGHTGYSMAAATALHLSCPKKYRKATILLVALAVIIGLSRLYLGVHYPTDVLAGGLLGILCAVIASQTVGKKIE